MKFSPLFFLTFACRVFGSQIIEKHMCVESVFDLSCNNGFKIEIVELLLGDSDCYKKNCCPKPNDCRKPVSYGHKNHVAHTCNGQQRCRFNVEKRSIGCTWIAPNNDYELIRYRCLEDPKTPSPTSTPKHTDMQKITLTSQTHTNLNQEVGENNTLSKIPTKETSPSVLFLLLTSYRFDARVTAQPLVLRKDLEKLEKSDVEKSPEQNFGTCEQILFNDKNYGTFNFENGIEFEEKNSSTRCYNNVALPIALARCVQKNNSPLYGWEIIKYYCVLNFTEILNEFTEITEEDIQKVLTLTEQNSDKMSSDEVSDVVDYLAKASEENNLNQKMGQNLINIVKYTMGAPVVSNTMLEGKDAVVKSKMKIINSLEMVVSKMDLENGKFKEENEKFVIEVKELIPQESQTFKVNLTSKDYGEDTVEIFIPLEAFRTATNDSKASLRTSLIVYKSVVLFQNPIQPLSTDSDLKVNSYVISGSIKDANVENLKQKIVLTFKLNNSTETPSCVFAKMGSSNWYWSEGGMNMKSYDPDTGVVECESDHLTNFAVLAGYHIDKHMEVLTYISIVGMVLSIICLSFVVFTQMFFKKFRKGQYQIALLNLSVSLIIVNLLIILGLDRTSNKVVCGIVAALLHYFLLVTFAWMVIEAILQYLKFVKVFDVHVRKFVWKTMLPAWIIPALLVIITAIIDNSQYHGRNDYCWLTKEAFYYAFLLPLGLIMVANIFIFIRIIKGISCDRPKGMQTNQTKTRLVWLQVQAGICCFAVMGLTWCFALFAFGEAALVMQFLFAIFNSLQGCFVFILFCLREKPVRMTWYYLLSKSKAPKKMVTSSDSGVSFGKYRKAKKMESEISTTYFSKITDSTDDSLCKISKITETNMS